MLKLPKYAIKIINLNQISEVMTLLMRKKKYYEDLKKIDNPKKIYWISPERIKYSSNFQNQTKLDTYFMEKNRGQIVDGNWDKTDVNFIDLEIYRTIKATIEEDEELGNTDYFKRILIAAKNSSNFWATANTNNLQKLFEYFSLKQLIPSHEKENHRISIHFRKNHYDAIDVNIGRNGEYLFQNNAYLLSIAKVLKVKSVPVRVFARHKKWQELRKFVINYLQNEDEQGSLYQPIVHPDLQDISVQPDNRCQETMDAIESHLTSGKSGTMLDLGAYTGFFCYKFEDLGYQCYAIEKDPNTFRILEEIKDAENKKFVTLNKSVFEVDLCRTVKFDVVLALNIFHHFLKTKALFYSLKELLQNLKTEVMFVSTANPREEQMRNAYQNYSEPRFAEFISQQTMLNKSEVIFTTRYGRNVYKLSK